MDFLQILTGSLLWATLFSIALFVGGSIATNFLAKKSKLLKPIASGLKLIALFVAIQAFLILGGNEGFPQVSRYLRFFSWLIAIFALLRLTLYMYGDLFVVRWKKGSFPFPRMIWTYSR